VKLSRQVWLLGWVSLLTDAATEIVYPLLPIYLSSVLGAGPLALGVIEGVADGINSLLRVGSGWLSDRVTRRKPIVIIGYALSSLARPLIALAGTWVHVLIIRALDRTGKGIRGAPRDAMLAGYASPETRGRVFGFHRAMDHAGAIVGPLIATVFLFFLPGQYRTLFALTAIPGVFAVATLCLVREEATHEAPSVAHPRTNAPSHPRTNALSHSRTDTDLSRTDMNLSRTDTHLPRQLIAVLAVILVFSLGSSADAFLLLRLSEAFGGPTYVPLLWAALHVVKASLSTWGGSLSDRLGRKSVIGIGWSIYAIVYLGFALSSTATAFTAWFLLYGVFFALTEGAEKALVADLAQSSRRGTAFGFYNAVLGIGTVVASVTFGFLYEWFGSAVAFATGAMLAAVSVIALSFVSTEAPRGGRQVRQ
jgi:MFS family permease